MTNVTGIGGIFFRAKDAGALGKWYEDALGIDILEKVWTQDSGPTIFMPFESDTAYFESDRQWMINFRVSDLDALIDHLKSQNIDIITKPEWDSKIGRFARIHDPEGNPLELWEPAQGAF